MVRFKPGDHVRVNDEWWAANVRPGVYSNPCVSEHRNFVVDHIDREAVILKGNHTGWKLECFELIGGPW